MAEFPMEGAYPDSHAAAMAMLSRLSVPPPPSPPPGWMAWLLGAAHTGGGMPLLRF